VQIPEFITIKNTSNQTVAFLSPDDGLKNCYIDIRLNGESTLEFLLPANSEKLAEITPECKIIAGGREYVLLKDDAIDFERTEDNKLWAKVMAVESWALLDTKYPEPYITNDPNVPVPANLTVIIVGGGSDLSGGRYTVGSAGHALYALLQGTGWSIGTVDVAGIHDLETEKESILSNIKKVQEIWGGYLVWDSINKTVSLRDANTWQPYNGFQIRYAKNLKHITKTQNNRLVTKLYPFGKDDLDIASVNSGVKYITNFSYTTQEYVGIIKYPDIENAQELKDKAIAELSLICRPRYLYRVKIADLRTLPEYAHEDFAVGDMADVIDPAIGTTRARIIRHKYNVFMPWNCEFELGDPEERLIESLKASFDTTGFIDGVFNSSGKISGYNIQDASITGDKIANATIIGNHIQSASITGSHIGSLTITANNIADLTITGGKIANATIDDAKITSLSANKITAGTITASISIQAPTIIGGLISGTTISGATINSGTINVQTDAVIGSALHLYKDSNPYVILKNMSVTGGQTSLIIGKVVSVGAGIAILNRVDLLAGTLYVYNSIYAASSISIAGDTVATQPWVTSTISSYLANYYTKTEVEQAIDSAIQDHVLLYH